MKLFLVHSHNWSTLHAFSSREKAEEWIAKMDEGVPDYFGPAFWVKEKELDEQDGRPRRNGFYCVMEKDGLHRGLIKEERVRHMTPHEGDEGGIIRDEACVVEALSYESIEDARRMCRAKLPKRAKNAGA